MKNIIKIAFMGAALLNVTGCIEEILPQQGVVTEGQAGAAPGSFDNFVAGLTSTLCGDFVFGSSNTYAYDFGYPSFYLQRDVMGQDIAIEDDGDWFQTWYTCGTALGPQYLVCQLPMTYFYGWINDCNTVISMAGDNPDETQKSGAGIARTMRAMFYMDIAQMFAPETYLANKDGLTCPLRTDQNKTITHVARATNEEMYNFIISDLNKAEELLADYKRTDVYTPDRSVVYGLKARAYLIMGEWALAEEYAKKAQEGYTMMSESAYLSRTEGFNTPNSSWMFGLTYKSSDPNITLNDGDSSWGAQMILEVHESGMGYASNYGYPKRIDAHLYSTIPATDFRRKVFVDPAIDEMDDEEAWEALKAYTDDPNQILGVGASSTNGIMGLLELKFRPKGGITANQYEGWTVAVPIMRVEEMKLIEAEAAGRQDLNRGIELLTAFAKTRDPQYSYENQNADAYYNYTTGEFVNKIWWQRRVEFWGEGLATYDIKRLQKGIIRSYAGTNHPTNYRWNVNTPQDGLPSWMTWCFVQTESNYNNLLVQNPTPSHDSVDDPEYVW